MEKIEVPGAPVVPTAAPVAAPVGVAAVAPGIMPAEAAPVAVAPIVAEVAPAISIDIEAALAPVIPTPAAAPVPEAIIAPVIEPVVVPVPVAEPSPALAAAALEVNELHINPVPLTAAEVATTSATVAAEVAANDELSGTEIASIKSAYWSAFYTFIQVVSPDLSSADILSITNGKMALSKDGGIMTADLSDTFGNNSWHILDPKDVVKRLKLIKGGTKVTIMDDGPQNIVYNSDTDVIKTVVLVTKPEVDHFSKVEPVDPGDFKKRQEIELDTVTHLIAAKKALNAVYYNVTIDVTTHEILSIDIDSKFKENLINATGRETMRYKVKELFPIAKPDNMLIEVYDKAGQLSFKTLADLTMTTVNFQIPALKFPNNAAYDY